MLKLDVPISPEGWDELKQEFVEPKTKTIELEHSLVSISKWEMKWKKPFFSNENKSYEEFVDYVKFMTLTKNVDPSIYSRLTQENFNAIKDYINDPMTATTFTERGPKKSNREIITSEIVYYWMVTFNIPFECQKWHFNRLMALIKVCSIKNTPPKKMSRSETLRQNAALNAARRKQHNTRG